MRIQIAKYKKIFSSLALGLGVFGLFLTIRTWKSLRQPIPQLEFPKQPVPDIPGSFHLRTVSVQDNVRVHLLDEDFKIVRRMNEIPNSCTMILESSFVTINGFHAKPGEITWANPGEAFQASDNIVPGLPFRRLEFAGLGSTKCFIHYQSGGQPNSFCLAVIDAAEQKLAWVGESINAAKNVDELRRMIFQRRFGDPGGWVRRGC